MFPQTDNRPYGQLDSNRYLLTFDPKDETEAKAKKAAKRLLESQRGKLKQTLISMLAAVYDAQEATGKPVDVSDFSARVLSAILNGNALPVPQITELTMPDELPVPWAGSAEHADPVAARHALHAGMGNLLNEDEDF